MGIEECVNELCPWSGKPVQADSLAEYKGRIIGFCNTGCRDKFAANPKNFPEVIALIGAVT